jgi:hypothetical protein
VMISELFRWASVKQVARPEAQLKTLKEDVDSFAKGLHIVVQHHLDIDQAFRLELHKVSSVSWRTVTTNEVLARMSDA